MEIHKLLEKIGLTETERMVYVAGLSLGPARATTLADKTKLKRPRVYHALDTLEERGLMGKRPSKGPTLFIAEPPEQLISILRRKQIDLEELQNKVTQAIPSFPSFDQKTLGFPHVQYFQGLEGMKTIAEKVYTDPDVEVLGMNPPFSYLEGTISMEYAIAYLDMRAKLGMKTRSIWQDEPEVKEFANHSRFERTIRMAPVEKFGEFKTIVSIVGNKVILLSVQPELFGLLITSATVAQTMTSMWNTVWKAATPLDEYTKP